MEWMLLPLKRYADFKGRSRRKEYWMFVLLNLIVSTVLLGPLVVSIISNADALDLADDTADLDALASAGPVGLAFAGVYILWALAIFIPSIALTIRRLHDRDMSGWWYLGLVVVSLVPVIGSLGSIALLVLMALPGTAGPNRFGPDPKNPFDAEVFA